MKLKFKRQKYQTDAVEALVQCFSGQPNSAGIQYRIDPGRSKTGQMMQSEMYDSGFKNPDFQMPPARLLENIQAVQRKQNLPQAQNLSETKICKINLDIEMETGTGKTYCYIKSMFELNKLYGWSKFIVVVPSIAIREGVYKSFQITSEHFLETYGKKARFFIYNSKQLHNLESFSSDSGINVMIINVQAFNATGKDARRIYEELDDFQSRKPIDVIKANRPIMILDEPQKMEGAKTLDSLKEFNPLMVLRYSATHKTTHNKIYRLDALDAFNQKLVKKISVRGISVKGLSGTNAYLYLENIEVSPSKPPIARIELEIKHKNGIKRERRRLEKGSNLYDESGLDQYKGFVISDIDAFKDTVAFTNGVEITSGEAAGDINESVIRRIQIREAIKAHFEKEQTLFNQGIKVLSLFFIDEVAKYRLYNESGAVAGEYARIFEEEYKQVLNDILTLEDTPYNRYLKAIDIPKTHNGYFSIDKKTNRLVDPETGKKSNETDDVDAYDLILRDKEKLLSFDEPTRFIFSHSALREGWDNPNVFVICTLKHSDNTISRRQEVGRGLRLSVNQHGDRMDHPATVHQINVLTVVASESYKDFVTSLQKDISDSLSSRPRKASVEYFSGKIIPSTTGDLVVTDLMARKIYKYLIKYDYINEDNDEISQTYIEAKRDGKLESLPEEMTQYSEQIFKLIDSVYTNEQLPDINDDRKNKLIQPNKNFEKKEFQDLWSRINRKAVYSVHFETSELIKKCVSALDQELRVTPLQYIIQRGDQSDQITYDTLKDGDGFKVTATLTNEYKTSVHSSVKYDLTGKISTETKLTRKTVSSILREIKNAVFAQFKTNPEDFICKAITLINEQKATIVIEHLAYDALSESYSSDIFTEKKSYDLTRGVANLKKHIYDFVFTDSSVEREFAQQLDTLDQLKIDFVWFCLYD